MKTIIRSNLNNFKTLHRYFIQLAFKGTNYHGWQIQKNAISVQQIINSALTTLLKEEVLTVGAGRTDAGVHAKYYIAHFDTNQASIHLNNEFMYSFNHMIPNDICVQKIIPVIPEAHARFDAISRTYRYYISRVKDPFSIDTSWQFTGYLNIELMKEATPILMNYSDFSSFSKLGSDNKTNTCKIFHLDWDITTEQLVFTIKADRFLRNMVRAIVGTLYELGRGKLTIQDFRQIIESRDRSQAGTSAPAHGLYLYDIEYDKGIYLK